MRRADMTHTFDETIISDLHKEARGFRPRAGNWFCDKWDNADDDGKQAIWDGLIAEMQENDLAAADHEAGCLLEFKQLIADTIENGAGDDITALRWLIQDGRQIDHSQDIDHFFWEYGVLHTEYGKECAAALLKVFEKEWKEPDQLLTESDLRV
jgi:hypothetical protein